MHRSPYALLTVAFVWSRFPQWLDSHATLKPEPHRNVALHAERKLGDEIVGVEDIGDAVVAIDKLIARLDIGEWAKRRNR